MMRMSRTQRAFVFCIGFFIGVIGIAILSPYIVDAMYQRLQGVEASVGNGIIFFFLTVLVVCPFIPTYTLLLIGTGFVFGWWAVLICWTGRWGLRLDR